MSLPMSWMSPCTVHITTVPSFSPEASALRYGFSLAVMPVMISPAMMSSGMNASPSANRWPMTSIASRHAVTISSGSVPPLQLLVGDPQRVLLAQLDHGFLESA